MTLMKPEGKIPRVPAPPIGSKAPGILVLDNYIIHELFLREDFPEYFTEEERTFEAIVEAARKQREADQPERGADRA